MPTYRLTARIWRRLRRFLARSAWVGIDRLDRRHPGHGEGVATAVLDRAGATVLRTASADRIRRVLATLYPVSAGHPLVRLGPVGDGGYLVPDDLDGLGVCMSAGVGEVAGFELDCAERGMVVHLADGSVSGPPVDHDSFHFLQRHIGIRIDGCTTTFDDWVAATVGDSTDDLLLQMDIEGDEWSVLAQMSDAVLQRCRIIVLELHGLPALLTDVGFPMVAPVLERIAESHVCVHLHPNNCMDVVTASDITLPEAVEATFLRKDRARSLSYVTDFPHPLDADNSDRPTLLLPSSLIGDAP